MSRSLLSRMVMAAAFATVSIGVAGQQTSKPADSKASDEQAARGDTLYGAHCRACHGADLAGTEFGPGITGAEFRARWSARPALDLFDTVRTTMPVNSPGGLGDQQYADLTAFILKRGGLPPGQAAFAPRAASAQVARGRTAFLRHCALCHTSGEPSMDKTAAQPDRGLALGRNLQMRALPIRHYPTVYNLYQRIRDSMPGWDIDAASPSEKVDIVAYLLQSNKVPFGSAELTLDIAAMKKLPIATVAPFAVEEGFEPLIEGSRLRGMKYLFGFNCTPAPVGCGRTDAAGVVTVRDGVVAAEGRYHGLIYTEKKYGDFDLRFDYRWVPPPDVDPEDEFYAVSSGYMIFMEEPIVWPKSIEVEGNELNILAASPVGGGKSQSTYDRQAVERYRKPVGKWNTVRLVSSGGDVKIYLNGGLTTHITQHTYTPGNIGFQYQGGRIEWRRIRIKG